MISFNLDDSLILKNSRCIPAMLDGTLLFSIFVLLSKLMPNPFTTSTKWTQLKLLTFYNTHKKRLIKNSKNGLNCSSDCMEIFQKMLITSLRICYTMCAYSLIFMCCTPHRFSHANKFHLLGFFLLLNLKFYTVIFICIFAGTSKVRINLQIWLNVS